MIQESPLIKTLQLLNKQELETLAGFVKSEIFHRDMGRLQATGRLFEHIQTRMHNGEIEIKEQEVINALFRPTLKQPKKELHRLMSQLFDVVKQYITFSNFISLPDSAPKKETKASKAKKTALNKQLQRMVQLKEDAAQFLNYARRELALMRFYNQRINLRPQNEPSSDPPAPEKQGRKTKIKRPENFFTSAYARLKEHLDLDNEVRISYQFYTDSEYAEVLYHNFQLEHEMFVYQNIANHKRGDINLLAVTSALDQFYFINRLELTLRWLIQASIANPYGIDADALERRQLIEAEFEKFAKLVRDKAPITHPLINLYLNSIALFGKGQAEKKELFEHLLNEIEKWESWLPLEKRNDLYTIVRNYTANEYNRSKNPVFLRGLHQLQKAHFQKGYLTFTIDGKQCIHPSRLQGIVSLASKVNDLDWALSVVEQFPADRIMPSQQASIIHSINLAHILVEQQHPGKAAKVLGPPKKFREIKELHYRSWANRIHAKILFEQEALDEYDSKSFIRATRQWINRENGLEDSSRHSNDAFFELITQIFRIKHTHFDIPDGLFQELCTLKTNLSQDKPAEFEWLLKKIEQLGAELMHTCMAARDFAKAGEVVNKVFGGLSRLFNIHHTESRNQMLIWAAQLCYELNTLRRPRRMKVFKFITTDYLDKQSGFEETEDQLEFKSFFERLSQLFDLREMQPDGRELELATQAIHNRIHRKIENDWIHRKAKELTAQTSD